MSFDFFHYDKMFGGYKLSTISPLIFAFFAMLIVNNYHKQNPACLVVKIHEYIHRLREGDQDNGAQTSKQ
jgi:hypothetical protein